MIEQKGEENVEIRNCINMGVVLSESSGGAGNFTGSICGYNNASIEHCYWLYDPSSGAGMEKGIPFGEGTAQNNFPLSEVQLKGATYGSQLFVMADGTSCTTLLDAMNGWAYDQRQLEENIKESGWKDRLYSGWHYPSTGAWPALTGNPATHP